MSYHFISGLPRSGSTLLAALFCQNPAFHAGIISPMGPMTSALRSAMSPKQETHVFVDVKRGRVLEALFDAFYEDNLQKVVFDTNRRWCADIAMLGRLFPKSRVIACVRQPAHVVDSFERLFQKHPYAVSTITKCKTEGTVYDRAATLLAIDGVVGYAYNALREAFYGANSHRLIILEYVNLAKAPKETMAWLHECLGEAPFDYDFDHIKQIPEVELFDRTIGTPGLHAVKEKVVYTVENIVLPPDIVARMPPVFWRPPPSVKKDETNSG
jgi:sulfotransferase